MTVLMEENHTPAMHLTPRGETVSALVLLISLFVVPALGVIITTLLGVGL